MDYTAVFDKSEDQIDFNENEVRVEKKNNKRKFVYWLIGIGVFVLICVVILFGWKLMKHEKDCSISNDTIENEKSSWAENESQYDSKMEVKRQFVKEMMIDAWDAYERYAWGHGEVRPVLKEAYGGYFGNNSGLTLVTSMSTLWIMGLQEEFNRGKQWIETELDLSKVDGDVGVYDVIVNYVGGLLSCYALTNEQLFMNKSLTIAQLVEPAFNTKKTKGLPYEKINLKTSKLSSLYSYLSYVSGFQLDFNYLSDASGNDKYRKQIEKIQNVLKKMRKPKNPYFEVFQIEALYWMAEGSTLFVLSREFYSSLVKSYIQSNHFDVKSIEMYKETMDAVEAVKLFEVSPNGLYYTRYYTFKKFENTMEYSGCYLGAMLSLGASAMQRALTLNSSIGDKDKVTQQNRINRHWHLAIQITRTCQMASDRTKTGLGPDRFDFNDTHDVIAKHNHYYYYLSPELAESNFILWRITHNERYRDNAWKMAQAIHRHCRVEGGGYSTILDVNQEPTSKDDRQPAEFLSATLKYLYLTFTSDSVLSLDQWVFNSKGHPLPICGNNTMYPEKLCKH